MSASNAAALRRRANIQPPTPSPLLQNTLSTQQQNGSGAPGQTQNVSSQGLTLPQVISLIDKRLASLEVFMKESKDNTQFDQEPLNTQQNDQNPGGVPKDVFNTIVQEFNSRFEILAIEINNIKDTLIKLQSYTMDVNKMLLDERVNIMSDINNNMTLTDQPSTPESFNQYEFSGDTNVELDTTLPSLPE